MKWKLDMEQKPVEINYEEQKFGGKPTTDVNLENIIGFIPRVTATPTWTPKLFKDNFAISLIAGNYSFWVYDPVAHVWKSTALT